MFNFEYMNKTLEERKNESVNKTGYMIICGILFHEIDVSNIDFDSFSMEELLEVENDFNNYIQYIDEPTEELLLLTNEHPFSVLESLTTIVSHMNGLRKVRVKSNFRFI